MENLKEIITYRKGVKNIGIDDIVGHTIITLDLLLEEEKIGEFLVEMLGKTKEDLIIMGFSSRDIEKLEEKRLEIIKALFIQKSQLENGTEEYKKVIKKLELLGGEINM